MDQDIRFRWINSISTSCILFLTTINLLANPALGIDVSSIDQLKLSAESNFENQINTRLSTSYPEIRGWVKISLEVDQQSIESKLGISKGNQNKTFPGLVYPQNDAIIQQQIDRLKPKDLFAYIDRVNVQVFTNITLTEIQKSLIGEIVSINLPNFEKLEVSYKYRITPSMALELPPEPKLEPSVIPPDSSSSNPSIPPTEAIKSEEQNWFLKHVGKKNLQTIVGFLFACILIYFAILVFQLIALQKLQKRSVSTPPNPAPSLIEPQLQEDSFSARLNETQPNDRTDSGVSRLRDVIVSNQDHLSRFLTRLVKGEQFSQIFLIVSQLPQTLRNELFAAMPVEDKMSYENFLLKNPDSAESTEGIARKFDLFLQSESAYLADEIRHRMQGFDSYHREDFLSRCSNDERQVIASLFDDRQVAQWIQIGVLAANDLVVPSKNLQTAKYFETLYDKIVKFKSNLFAVQSVSKLVKVGWYMDSIKESQNIGNTSDDTNRLTTVQLILGDFEFACSWIDNLSLNELSAVLSMFDQVLREKLLSKMPELKKRRVESRGFAKNENSGPLKYRFSEALFIRFEANLEKNRVKESDNAA